MYTGSCNKHSTTAILAERLVKTIQETTKLRVSADYFSGSNAHIEECVGCTQCFMKGKSNSLKKDLNGNITNFSLSKLNENNIIKNKNDDFDVKENKNKKKNYNNSKNKECSNNIKDSENNNIIVSNYFSNLMKLKIKDNYNKNLRKTNSNNK